MAPPRRFAAARRAGPRACLWWFVMQTMMLSPDNTVFMIKPGAPVRIGNPLLPLMTLIKGTTIHQRRGLAVCLCSRSSAGLWRSRGTSLSGSISIANETLLMLQNTFLMSCRNSKRCRCVSFCSGGRGGHFRVPHVALRPEFSAGPTECQCFPGLRSGGTKEDTRGSVAGSERCCRLFCASFTRFTANLIH